MPSKRHAHLPQPTQPDVKIWRYLRFTKFVQMIESGALFFSRADLLGDPHEGAVSLKTLKKRKELLQKIYHGPKPEHANMLESEAGWRKWMREWSFVNCWFTSEHESTAMWDQYAQGRESVAINSTYAALESELPNFVSTGLISYCNYDEIEIPEYFLEAALCYKRNAYAHERELRAMFVDFPVENNKAQLDRRNPDPGRYVPVNLRVLMHAIHVSPRAADWFLELVGKTLARHSYDTPVVRSVLDMPPVF